MRTITKATKTSFGTISPAQARLLEQATSGVLWSLNGSRRASVVKLHALGLIDAPEFGAKLTANGVAVQVELFGELPPVGAKVARMGDGKVGVVAISEYNGLEVHYPDGTTSFGLGRAFAPVESDAADAAVPAADVHSTPARGRYVAVVDAGVHVVSYYVCDRQHDFLIVARPASETEALELRDALNITPYRDCETCGKPEAASEHARHTEVPGLELHAYWPVRVRTAQTIMDSRGTTHAADRTGERALCDSRTTGWPADVPGLGASPWHADCTRCLERLEREQDAARQQAQRTAQRAQEWADAQRAASGAVRTTFELDGYAAVSEAPAVRHARRGRKCDAPSTRHATGPDAYTTCGSVLDGDACPDASSHVEL